ADRCHGEEQSRFPEGRLLAMRDQQSDGSDGKQDPGGRLRRCENVKRAVTEVIGLRARGRFGNEFDVCAVSGRVRQRSAVIRTVQKSGGSESGALSRIEEVIENAKDVAYGARGILENNVA